MNENALDSGFHPVYLWFVCLVAATGGLLFGYDAVVVSEIFPPRIRGSGRRVVNVLRLDDQCRCSTTVPGNA